MAITTTDAKMHAKMKLSVVLLYMKWYTLCCHLLGGGGGGRGCFASPSRCVMSRREKTISAASSPVESCRSRVASHAPSAAGDLTAEGVVVEEVPAPATKVAPHRRRVAWLPVAKETSIGGENVIVQQRDATCPSASNSSISASD